VTPSVELRSVSKRFGAFRAVDDLSLTVAAGEIFGFLGSNGAGKTTAIRVMCGLLAPSSGTAHVLGFDVGREPEEVKRRIGYMSQRFSLYEDLTVGQNLRFFGGVYGLSRERLRLRVAWALEMADLGGAEGRLARELSGGWRQRLALACAALHEPRVLFLDEPTSGVDPVSRRRFWGLIDAMAAEGVTVFVTTHYLDEAERCGRIALMHAGKLVALGTPAELKDVLAGRTILELSGPRILEALDLLIEEPWVREASAFGTRLHLLVDDPAAASARARAVLAARALGPVDIEPIPPSLEDVFIHHIEGLGS
jgi:ABC-2 type transport system ATP-binding protein